MATSLKKKYTQNDLRRLMNEQKAKSAPKTTTTTINSPLAKYPFSKYLNLTDAFFQNINIFLKCGIALNLSIFHN